MTILAAWTRRIGDAGEELLFASDSRLSGGGRRVNHCPKVFALARGDCAIGFEGDVDVAYPLVIQVMLGIDAYYRSKTRAQDVRELKTHVVKVLNRLVSEITEAVRVQRYPAVSFLFGGYSWIHKTFDLWHIRFNRGLKYFAGHPISTTVGGIGKVAFAGDVKREAKRRFYHLLRERHDLRGRDIAIDRLDMEPFEVIRDMLRQDAWPTIGGAPQLAKVYQHMNARIQGVYWPDFASQSVCIGGRPVLPYEDIDTWILDPDGLRTYHLSYTPTAAFEAHPE